ncbi:MAG: dUTP diphosphatase [Candidatus Alkaliphilus sp. MAG34]|nr:dUTPase [Clostridiales bacterium]
MDISELYEIQEKLDNRICIEHGLKGMNLVPSKILALQVELGELANETRCFKFWSNKGSSPRETILEEYVDCLHFILSIGLENGLTDINPIGIENTNNLTEQFQNMFMEIVTFQHEPTLDNYQRLFNHFLLLGGKLDFTEDEIRLAYLEKNKINHQRQDEGY